MRNYSALQRDRLTFKPVLPLSLNEIHSLITVKEEILKDVDSTIQTLFPLTKDQSFLTFHSKINTNQKNHPLKIGVLFSGGQAPGGHNVIAGIFDAIKKINPHSELIGFLHGFKGLLNNQSISLNQEIVDSYRNQGGFDMIGSERTKLETLDQLTTAEKTIRFHQLDGMVVIGGDDSNTNAAFLAEFCKKQGNSVRVVGVPKTIDGDLKNEWIEISFGFDTASKIYSEMIGNLLIDSLSAKKYYFFNRLMGRSTSHITLECALQTQVNLALIGEEIGEASYKLTDIVDQIADLVCLRSLQGKDFGMILIPEGLLEFIPECRQLLKELNQFLNTNKIAVHANGENNHLIQLLKEQLSDHSFNCFSCFPSSIQMQLLLDRDGHGNVQLAKIETERLLMTLVGEELEKRRLKKEYQGKFSPVPLYFGYEGRSGLPTNFDCHYCYALGYVSALLVQHEATGYIACIRHLEKPVEEWEPCGVPLTRMMQMEDRGSKNQAVIKKALVDLKGTAFLDFKEKRKRWETEDVYLCPGPIQFNEAKFGLNPPISLKHFVK